MDSIKILEGIDNSLNDFLTQTKTGTFVKDETDTKINSINASIKENFRIDYTKKLKFRKDEKNRLHQIFIDYLKGRFDGFNSHYIQLLAWNISDLKIFEKKRRGTFSIYEYSPFKLAPYTMIEKTFRLFNKKRIDFKKVYFPLLTDYLNNYDKASKRYKKNMRKFLKKTRISNNVDIYFKMDALYPDDGKKAIQDHISQFRIEPKVLYTRYFSDVWANWMLTKANLNDEFHVLRNLDCKFFDLCSEETQKSLLAKIICTNIKRQTGNSSTAEEICNRIIFPAIKKGNPFKKEFWISKSGTSYKSMRKTAWEFIESKFVKNESYRIMIESIEKNEAKAFENKGNPSSIDNHNYEDEKKETIKVKNIFSKIFFAILIAAIIGVIGYGLHRHFIKPASVEKTDYNKEEKTLNLNSYESKKINLNRQSYAFFNIPINEIFSSDKLQFTKIILENEIYDLDLDSTYILRLMDTEEMRPLKKYSSVVIIDEKTKLHHSDYFAFRIEDLVVYIKIQKHEK